MSHEGPSITAALEERVHGGASAIEISEAIADTWRHIQASLTPVVGPQGVAALYKRSLLLTGRSHPWLAELPEPARNGVDLAALTAALSGQDSLVAARGGGDMLQSFNELVTSLIGASLTHRLLPFMWQTF